MYSLSNIKQAQIEYSVIHKQRVNKTNRKSYYRLLNDLQFELSNGDVISIEKGFIWDLASIPRFLWSLLPTDGDFDVAYLIHDYLYVNKKSFYDRKFMDKEMLKWSIACSGTKKFSLRNIDNCIRYYGVRIFGGLVWNGHIKI